MFLYNKFMLNSVQLCTRDSVVYNYFITKIVSSDVIPEVFWSVVVVQN